LGKANSIALLESIANLLWINKKIVGEIVDPKNNLIWRWEKKYPHTIES
jgi:hypothetical protein